MGTIMNMVYRRTKATATEKFEKPLTPATSAVLSSHAMADAPHEPPPPAHPAPRGRLAQAPADGGGPAARLGVDPAREPGDDGALSVARAGDPIVPGGGDAAQGRSRRDDDRRGDHGSLSQGAQ